MAAASSGAASAGLAIDQDVATAWVAEGPVAGQWLSLDLGGAYDNIRKVEVAGASTTTFWAVPRTVVVLAGLTVGCSWCGAGSSAVADVCQPRTTATTTTTTSATATTTSKRQRR